MKEKIKYVFLAFIIAAFFVGIWAASKADEVEKNCISKYTNVYTLE